MKYSLLIASLFIGFQTTMHAQSITNFGSSQFTITSSDFTDAQTSTSLRITGNDFGDTLVGTISTAIIPTSTIHLTLTGTLAGVNPNSSFQIALVDTAFNEVDFNGTWSAFASGSQTSATLNIAQPVPGFNGDITEIALFTGGTGSPLDFTFSNLSVTASVPEPSSSNLILIAIASLVCGSIRPSVRRLI